jgi:hypothetical protein
MQDMKTQVKEMVDAKSAMVASAEEETQKKKWRVEHNIELAALAEKKLAKQEKAKNKQLAMVAAVQSMMGNERGSEG